jgi:hypothetical protein
MTIYGLGGCGKSALAIEFAYRALARHAGYLIFWVPAISQESFELAYLEIGNLLHLQGTTDDNTDVKQLVKKALSSDSFGDWLMIIDKADDPGVLMGTSTSDPQPGRLSDCLPWSSRGTILFTTRSRKAAADLTQTNVLEPPDMEGAEAKQLLAQRIWKESLLDDTESVKEYYDYLRFYHLQSFRPLHSSTVMTYQYLSISYCSDRRIQRPSLLASIRRS